MLIRSQNKTILINFNNSIVIDIMLIENVAKIVCSYSYDDYIIGRYSSKAKALKVLDMIQNAYADFESEKITSTGLATGAYAIGLSYDTPENVFDGINALKEYGDSIKELMVFQMPADSEVEA